MIEVNGIETTLHEGGLGALLNLPPVHPYPQKEWGDKPTTYDTSEELKPRESVVSLDLLTTRPDELMTSATTRHITQITALGGRIDLRVQECRVVEEYKTSTHVQLTGVLTHKPMTTSLTLSKLEVVNTIGTTGRLTLLDGTDHHRRVMVKAGVTTNEGYKGGAKPIKERKSYNVKCLLTANESELWQVRQALWTLLSGAGGVQVMGVMMEYASCSTRVAVIDNSKVYWELTLSLKEL